MGYNSKQTRERVLESAKKEFLELGYQNSSMRSIAKNAEVTTGAMYNHFSNKEELFDALVQAPAEEMLIEFQRILQSAMDSLSYENIETISEKSESGTDWMLSYIYQHFDCFRLIFCCSDGTRWVSYLDDLIALEEKYHRIYFDKLGNINNQIEDVFVHITVASSFQYLVEIVSHDLPYEEAVSVMNKVKAYCMAGWTKILEF